MTEFEFNIDYDDDNEENEWQWGGKTATIFLIDTSPKMMDTLLEKQSAFIMALKCAHSSISRKIISNDQEMSGIVFFNTKELKNEIDGSNIYVFQGIDKPGAERILELENLIENGKGLANSTIGSADGATIQDSLWVCQNLFISSKNKLSSKNILVFTANDDPHAGDDHKKHLAFKKAKDVYEAGINLQLLPFGSDFVFEKFYKGLLLEGKDEDSNAALSILADPTNRFEELLDRVRRYEHKQRTIGRVYLKICPGVEFGVKVYTALSKTYKPSKVNLYKATNEEVIKKRKECLENGELLMPSDFAKYQEYGSKKIKFTLDEAKALNKVYESGIEVIGFKSLNCFKPYFYIKPSNFIYPDEAATKGGTKLFACLLERCLSRKICPIVRFQARQNSTVSWAFLFPQKEEMDELNCQIKPSGFHVCFLPFADDFRNIEIENRVRARSEQVDKAKEILKKLHFKYSPELFDNPDIQTHWRNVEALALNRTYLEPVVDFTVPDVDRIEKKANSLINEFKSLVFSPNYDPNQVIKKRPFQQASSENKKSKSETASLSVEELVKAKSVEKSTVDVLKKWLIEKGVSVIGKKKAQLVQDVYDEFQ